MAVDDPGARRMDCSQALKRRLQGKGFRASQHRQVVDAVAPGVVDDRMQAGNLCRRVGNDQLAASAVRYATLLCIRVQRLLSANAQRGLQRSGGIVDSGVNDFAVAGTDACPDRCFRLQHQHLVPTQCQCTRDGQANDTGADHDAVDFLHDFPQTLARRKV